MHGNCWGGFLDLNEEWCVVGFDSAWTSNNSGAIVVMLRRDDGGFYDLGPPIVVNYADAERVVRDWQAEWVHAVQWPARKTPA
jgi:predicted RNase H-like nuclease